MHEDELLKLFGYNVKYYRLEAGLSQEQLGALVFLSDKYIGSIENGLGNTTLVKICRIANALNVKPEKLFENVDHGVLKEKVNIKK